VQLHRKRKEKKEKGRGLFLKRRHLGSRGPSPLRENGQREGKRMAPALAEKTLRKKTKGMRKPRKPQKIKKTNPMEGDLSG